jgi:hypothetical protein
VGELFDEPELAGVCLSTRNREDNLSVWNKDNTKGNSTRFAASSRSAEHRGIECWCSGDAIRFKIGEKMREILSLDPSIKVLPAYPFEM